MDLTAALSWRRPLALLPRLGRGGGSELVGVPEEEVLLQLRRVAVEQLETGVADDLRSEGAGGGWGDGRRNARDETLGHACELWTCIS